MYRLLCQTGVTVARRQLWAGDYEVGDLAIVERKTVRGLHLAIVNGISGRSSVAFAMWLVSLIW